MKTIAVVLYSGVEPIDLAVVGVLSMARRIVDDLAYYTVSESGGAVTLQNGLVVQADHAFASAPPADVVIVTGGPGWDHQTRNPAMLDFLRERVDGGEIVGSVCTGAMILAAAGMLSGKQATTKYEVVPPEHSPLASLRERFGVEAEPAWIVDEGAVFTGGGVTLGIDTTLYLLQRLFGETAANETARIMEYGAAWRSNQARLPAIAHRATLETSAHPSAPERGSSRAEVGRLPKVQHCVERHLELGS